MMIVVMLEMVRRGIIEETKGVLARKDRSQATKSEPTHDVTVPTFSMLSHVLLSIITNGSE